MRSIRWEFEMMDENYCGIAAADDGDADVGGDGVEGY